MELILFYGLLFFVVWLPEKVSGSMKFLIFLVLFFSLSWLFDRRRQKQLEKQRKEDRKRLEEQTRREEKRRKQLEQSVKYNTLCRILNDLKPFRVSITLKLHSLNEFRMYNKAVALDVAYSEICAKYKFLADNHFLDKFKNVSAFSYSTYDYVRKKEEEVYTLVDKAIHTPVKVIWSYTSPAGVNHYEDSAYVTVQDLQEYTRQRNLRQQHIDSEQYRRERERQLITPGLRYDILQRDNFRCQICGRTAQDGVKLEVDHKKPIAKGGRTEPDNLWTLCQDCNRGKGAKYYVSE